MIQLDNDALHFRFPNVLTELKRLADSYVAETLPHELAKDANGCLNRLLFQEYPDLPDGTRIEASGIKLQLMTSADIANRFTKLVGGVVHEGEPKDSKSASCGL